MRFLQKSTSKAKFLYITDLNAMVEFKPLNEGADQLVADVKDKNIIKYMSLNGYYALDNSSSSAKKNNTTVKTK